MTVVNVRVLHRMVATQIGLMFTVFIFLFS